jgi:hypothetical protein
MSVILLKIQKVQKLGVQKVEVRVKYLHSLISGSGKADLIPQFKRCFPPVPSAKHMITRSSVLNAQGPRQ